MKPLNEITKYNLYNISTKREKINEELMSPIERNVLKPPRGKDGLFIQPNDVSPKRENEEEKNRMRFAGHFKFADMYVGDGHTYDEEGRYNCGRCNQAYEGACLLVKVKRIDKEAGSCGDWENRFAGDPEMLLKEKSIDFAGYAIAKNG